MRLAFLGTPDFAARALEAVLDAGHEIACVYSQPPAPRGRGQALRPSPVHAFAESRGLMVRTPASLKGPEEVERFRALNLDAAVVVAFGQILTRDTLETPRLGCFNLHASLLPRWRGAAPIQRAIMAGDAVTGVQVMRMTEGLDEGPVLAGVTVPIEPLDTAGTLHDKLAEAGARLLVETLAAIEAGRVVETPQAEEGVTYARKISARAARLKWTRPAAEIDCKIRGLSPFPGAWFEAPSEKGRVRVKALLSRVEEGRGEPGEVLDDGLLVACGEGAVRLLKVQREGRGPQDVEVFLRGFPLKPGTRLG
ncbi:MAG: methionyl-tRNA formyltransferase [Phenylobacterium sp.]|jgi:methionyl-tRNA formyltransferase|uniref:methionyl-tRNA formyltransferase n=1 Tax=Phenylobacterium sp. TaxID=1871053 RepID=UPI002A36958B|nr:methionyl-tRNA formyltransferase [Phenylobacterium sp.]MDX9999189.1 methionyl-tRNA formyltransferase [Phenylobacterium sp.]